MVESATRRGKHKDSSSESEWVCLSSFPEKTLNMEVGNGECTLTTTKKKVPFIISP